MKLLVFDVDGTLIDYKQQILDSTIESVNSCLNKGDTIAIASGRPFPGVKKYLDYFTDGKKYAICSNGASVYSYKGKRYYEDGLTIKDLKKIRNLFKNILEPINIFCFLDAGVGYYKKDFWVENEGKLNSALLFDLNNDKYDDTYGIEKIIISGEPSIIDKIIIPDELRKEYHIVRSSPFFYDFMKNGVDKASGIDFLYKHLNIEKSSVYTFGDAENDLLMIKAFNGIAMGNAIPIVKDVAKFITKDVTDHGIKYAIQKIYNH